MKGESYTMCNNFMSEKFDTSDILNDVNMLLSSETNVMETELFSKYQYMKTGDTLFIEEGCKDIVEKITESRDIFSESISEFQKNVSRGISSTNTEICSMTRTNIPNIDKLDDFKFIISGYKFKTLATKRINLSEVRSIVEDYNKSIDELQRAVIDDSKILELENGIRSYIDEANLSKVRAKIMGVAGHIDEYDFIDEVRRYYRGSALCVDIDVDKKYIKTIMEERDKLIKDRDLTIDEINWSMNMFSVMIKYITTSLEDLTNSKQGSTCRIKKVSFGSKGQVISSKLLNVDSDDTDRVSKCITILRLTYSKIVRLQSIVQVILSERLVALRDQLYQNLSTLNTFKSNIIDSHQTTKLIDTSSLSTIVGIGESYMPSTIQPVIDYTGLALENANIFHSKNMISLEKRYINEFLFVKGCLENMYVDSNSYSIMEASEASLKDKMLEFLDNMIGLFRKKVIEYQETYNEDIKNLYDKGILSEKAKSYGSMEILPYWKANNTDQDRNLIRTALTKGASNKDLDNLTYMSSLVSVSNVSEWDAKKGQIRGYLLNYFRCHEKDTAQVKKIKVSGAEISSKLKIMVDYILGYEKIANGLDSLKSDADTQISSLTNVQESFRFLEIEQRFIENSDIALLEGFTALLEADNEDKTGETVDSGGEKTSPTSVEASDSNKSDASSNSGDNKDESKPTSNRYANIYERFFELAITAYMTACEERYISYINILRAVNGGPFSSDKDKKEKTSGGKEKVTDSTLFTESYFNKPYELKGTSLYK